MQSRKQQLPAHRSMSTAMALSAAGRCKTNSLDQIDFILNKLCIKINKYCIPFDCFIHKHPKPLITGIHITWLRKRMLTKCPYCALFYSRCNPYSMVQRKQSWKCWLRKNENHCKNVFGLPCWVQNEHWKSYPCSSMYCRCQHCSCITVFTRGFTCLCITRPSRL